MPAPQLALLKQAIAIRTEHIAQAPTSLRVKKNGKSFSRGDFSITRDDGTVLFTVDGKVMSWTQKQAFRDASGLPLFEVYRKPMGVTWFVELPGERSNDPIMKLAPKVSALKDKLDLSVCNAANGGENVNLQVRGQDIWKLRTNVYLGDQVVMTAKRTDKLAAYVPGKGLEWHVDVAEGFDASLVSSVFLVYH